MAAALIGSAIRDLQMTIHGLRATSDHMTAGRTGTEDGAIADEIGHVGQDGLRADPRFADKAASARASRDRRERKMAEFENSAGV